MVSDDVGKRWHDPDAVRAATVYVAVVVAVAAVVFTAYALGDRHELWLAFATPAVLFVGAVAAFVKTYRDWRAGRTWPIWHGAGWFLLTTTLLSFGIPSMGYLA
jgi:FtsH-binding integral membrane protein